MREDPDISGDARRVGTGAVRKTHLSGGRKGLFIVDPRINETLPMYNQPPKSPLSGGLWKLRADRSYW